MGGHRVIRVDNRDNAGAERYFAAPERPRVSLTVVAFVMREYELTPLLEFRQFGDELGAQLGMAPHFEPFFLRELSLLEKDLAFNADLPHVVHAGGDIDLLRLAGAQLHGKGEVAGHLGNPLRVLERVVIAHVDDIGKRFYRFPRLDLELKAIAHRTVDNNDWNNAKQEGPGILRAYDRREKAEQLERRFVRNLLGVLGPPPLEGPPLQLQRDDSLN